MESVLDIVFQLLDYQLNSFLVNFVGLVAIHSIQLLLHESTIL